MSAQAILRCDHLSVGYRRGRRARPVLPPITATIGAGEFVAVLGPNGTGKSTLLRTLAGLQPPLSGAIALLGRPLAQLRAFDLARLIGVVLSDPIAVGALSGREMVGLGRYAHTGWSGRLDATDRAAVERALAAAGADHLAGRDCRELSDGERQRLNLARVLAQEPKLIILDEPTAYLDVSAREELMALLHRLTREEGMSVLASSHDLDLALRHADTVWLIDGSGGLVAGTPEDLVADGAIARGFGSKAKTDADEAALPIAAIRGVPRFVSLAENVMRRAGFTIAAADGAALVSIVVGDGGRWHATLDDGDISGTSYAALAQFARRLPSEVGHRTPAPPAPADQTPRKRGTQ